MTPEEEGRIRLLPGLIADEKDPEKVRELAGELAQLLSRVGKPWPIDEKPRSS